MRSSSTTRALVFGGALVVASSTVLQAQDLSVYRQFRLGMTVSEAAAAAGVPETEAKVVHTRPLLIQELEWRPYSSEEAESVRTVLLGFYGGELFRIVVIYRQERVEGLTEADLVAAISPAYGSATRPASEIIYSSLSQSWTDMEQVLARWEDDRVSINLFHTTYPSTFGFVMFSKRIAPLARDAIGKAIVIERDEAPARAAAEQQLREDADDARHAKARAANKAAFKFKF